jgi:hypothetical protein
MEWKIVEAITIRILYAMGFWLDIELITYKIKERDSSIKTKKNPMIIQNSFQLLFLMFILCYFSNFTLQTFFSQTKTEMKNHLQSSQLPMQQFETFHVELSYCCCSNLTVSETVLATACYTYFLHILQHHAFFLYPSLSISITIWYTSSRQISHKSPLSLTYKVTLSNVYIQIIF